MTHKKPIRRDYTLGNYFVPEDCRGGVAVDVGANIGNFEEKYGEFFSKIHFYEPIGSCYELCVKKTESMEHVSGYHACVLDKDADGIGLKMNPFDPYETGCMVEMNHIKEIDPGMKSFTELEKVPAVSLETVLSRVGGKIDYLKVDCEGAEYYFLMGKDLAQIKYIAVEFHGNLGAERWKKLCLWINKTHMIVHPQIVENKASYLIPNTPIVEVLYAPRISGMRYVFSGNDLRLVSG